jgi:acetolactate synthase-1/2/3 large subunit
MIGADLVVESLLAYDVRHVFGLPGDTSVPWHDALWRAQDRIRYVLARDERSAAFMADAYARVSGRPGVCDGPSGGGATYMVPGLAEANGSSIPLIALTTDNPLSYAHQGALTDLDQQALFRAVSKWTVKVERAEMIPQILRRAFRIATSSRPGVVQVTLPKDVLSQEADGAGVYAEEACRIYPSSRQRPPWEAIDRAASLLVAAKRAVVVAGGGVHIAQAWQELTELADRLAIPVATTINGKGSIAETHPLSLGVIGANGGRDYANQWVREADLVFFVGTKANYVDTAFWSVPPRRSQCTIIQLDVDPVEVGNNYPVEVGLVADAREALRDLLSALESHPQGKRREQVAAEIAQHSAAWWQGFQRAAAEDSSPVAPERIISDLERLLPKDYIIVADPGTPTPYLAAAYRLQRAGRAVVIPRAQGGLGYAIPAAVGAHMGRPGVATVGLCGDGSFTMSAGDLASVNRSGGPIVLVHFNNGCFGWIKMLQHLECEERYFAVDFTEGIDYVRVAEGFGLRGFRVERGAEFGGALRTALDYGAPAFIDVLSPPEHHHVPPVAAWRGQL